MEEIVEGVTIKSAASHDTTTKVVPMRTFSSSSHTSNDSTGSSNLERDHGDAAAAGNTVTTKMGNGHVEHHMTNGGDYLKGDADHMTNGDHVTDGVGHTTNGSILSLIHI